MSNRNPKAKTSRYILLSLIACLGYFNVAHSQPIVFLETFGNTGVGTCDQGTSANGFTTTNGPWNVTLFGVNDSAANKWYISATEPGMPVGGCATQGCHVNPVYTDRTLHIGNVSNSPNSAILCPTGDCGALYDAGGFQNAVQTNARAESPPFTMQAGKTYMLLFNYIEYADGATNIDNALVEFYNGAVWIPAIGDAPRTQNACGVSSYLWEKYNVILPVLSATTPNVQIGFTWTNDNGGVGTNPSFAVDSIIVIELPPPVANATASDTDICVLDCIDFVADSVPTGIYSWQFNGSSTPTSNVKNPTGICYPAPGTYSAILTVNTLAGSDVDTVSIVVNPCSVPVADFVASDSAFCERTCVTFTDLSTNGPTQWQWLFPGGIPAQSPSPSPPPVCYQTPGFYDVTLIVFNQFGSDTLTKTAYMQVDTCPVPIADFNSSVTQLCPEQCVTFTDNSQNGPILSYDWYFPGGMPETDTSISPTVCYDHDGQYDVQLIATNQYGSDTVYKYSEVSVSFLPGAFASPDTSMRFGESYQLNAGGGVTYLWSPKDGLDTTGGTSPIATPMHTTTYTVTISDAAGCSAIRQVLVTIIQDNNIFIPNAFSPKNGSGDHQFRVRGNNLYGVRLTIFDRWGEKIFESTDQSIGWDGTYNGKELDPGVFTYVATVNYTNKETTTVSGTVTLIR